MLVPRKIQRLRCIARGFDLLNRHHRSSLVRVGLGHQADNAGPTQNTYFAANWIMRGFVAVLVILPNEALAVGFGSVGSP